MVSSKINNAVPEVFSLTAVNQIPAVHDKWKYSHRARCIPPWGLQTHPWYAATVRQVDLLPVRGVPAAGRLHAGGGARGALLIPWSCFTAGPSPCVGKWLRIRVEIKMNIGLGWTHIGLQCILYSSPFLFSSPFWFWFNQHYLYVLFISHSRISFYFMLEQSLSLFYFYLYCLSFPYHSGKPYGGNREIL